MRCVTLFLCWTLAIPPPAAAASSGDAWSRLGQLPRTATVTINLRDGRALKGTVQAVTPEGLDFVDSRKETLVMRSDVKSSNVQPAKDKAVELRLRNDKLVSGKVLSLSNDSIRLLDSGSIVHLSRQEILRISQRVHGRAALIGAGIGAGTGAAYGAASWSSEVNGVPTKGSRAHDTMDGAIIFAMLGAAVMAIVGVQRTLYDSPSPH